MSAATPRAPSLAAWLTTRAFAQAVAPDLSAEVAVTRLSGLAQGGTTALEATPRQSRWRQLERPSDVADAAARLLQAALGHLGTGKDVDLGHRPEHLVVRP